MRDGFHMRRTPGCLATRTLPVANGLLGESRFGVVMRQQFGLGLGGLGKARLQYLRNTPVILLASTPQQRLIRSVLDESMLEHVGRLRRHTPLVHELCVYELLQAMLQHGVV